MTYSLKHSLSNKRPALVLFGISFITKLAFLVFVVADPHLLLYDPDSEGYYQIAENLLDHGQFSRSAQAPLVPDNLRTPVYPLFLVGVLGLTGRSLEAVAFAQILLSSLTVALVYLFGRSLLSDSAGKIAGVLWLLDFSAFVFAHAILTETLFTLLFLVAVIALYRFLIQGGPHPLIVSAVVLGLAALCRPIALYFFVPAVLLFVVRFGWCWRALRQWAIFSVAFAIIVTPWFIRNYFAFGVANLSGIQGVNLYLINATYLEADRLGLSPEKTDVLLEAEAEAYLPANANEAQRAEVYRKLALRKISASPLRYAKVHLTGLIPMLSDNNARDVNYFLGRGRVCAGARAIFFQEGPLAAVRTLFSGEHWPTYLLFSALLAFQSIIYLCAAYGFGQLWRRRLRFDALVLALPVSYLILMALPAGSVRFRFPAMPYVYLLAAPCLVTLYHAVCRKCTNCQ